MISLKQSSDTIEVILPLQRLSLFFCFDTIDDEIDYLGNFKPYSNNAIRVLELAKSSNATFIRATLILGNIHLKFAFKDFNSMQNFCESCKNL